jgi:sortase A
MSSAPPPTSPLPPPRARIARARRPDRGQRRRRRLRGLSTIAMVAGGLVLVDAALTLVWQEPVTALQTSLRQQALRGDLRRLEAAGPTPLERQVLAGLVDDRRRIAFLARSLHRRTPSGGAVGRIRIPRIGVAMVVVKGAGAGALRKGPGTYDQTGLPGSPGTVAIAGHRTTYLAPFRHIDALRAGNRIVLEMPYATFTYRVVRTRVVAPDALWILRRVSYDQLVLSACEPLFSASKRIVVFSRLASVEPTRDVAAGQPSEGTPNPLTPAPA